MLGGFITPADSSSTSLGAGLSIALKAERGIPDWLWGAVAQWSEHLQLKQVYDFRKGSRLNLTFQPMMPYYNKILHKSDDKFVLQMHCRLERLV